jgi:HD-like signal output (HDOD) protein
MDTTTSNRARALVNGIDQLVTLPTIYFEIRRIIESPNSTIADVAGAISTDPALSAKLLRIVNSPLYAQTRSVETLNRAIAMLGMVQVHDLTLTASLATSFARIPPSMMDMSRFWRDSVLRAALMKTLALRSGIRERERSFLQGLLGDIGHMVMYLRIPDTSAAALALAEATGEPLWQIERRDLGCDFAEVGGQLLQDWGLPAGIHGVVSQQCEPVPGKLHAREAALLHIAQHMVWSAQHNKDDTEDIAPTLWLLTKLSARELPEIMAESREIAEQMMHVLNGALMKAA